jgi:predicted Ser/Thr protein kinase
MDLASLGASIKERFLRDQALLTFDEFYRLFQEDPRLHARNAAQYVLDCLESIGEAPEGEGWHFKLFEAPFDDGRDVLVDQAPAQRELARILRNFVRDGRVSKLILFHGPNGSAKTRLVDCLFRALEWYSRQSQGAVYRFNWIFPTRKGTGRKLGFGEKAQTDDLPDSFAGLPEEEVEARLPCGMRDHPLLLLPAEQRRALFRQLGDAGRLPAGFRVADYFLYGDLSGRNRKIADTLLTMHSGDYAAVLRHVQVERFYLSARYQEGLVTLYPQMQVDASARQLTMNQGVAILPNILKNVELYEPFGDMVDANRGAIIYDDLLKRPLETFKYLLSLCEANRVNLPHAVLYLDTLLLATSNDKHLDAFKQYPDFISFKERLELVRMSYARDYHVEARIYSELLGRGEVTKHLAPHALDMAALWAVSTRLKPSAAENAPHGLQKSVRHMGPVEKAFFYADGVIPEGVEPHERAEFEALRPVLLDEGAQALEYEGSTGISPREMKTVLLNAAQHPDHACLSPLAVFAEVRHTVRDKSVYEFLRREPEGEYYRYERNVDRLEQELLERVNREFLDAAGLVSREQYSDLFRRYINEVVRLLKGEKVRNRLTGDYEEADTRFLESTEARFGSIGNNPRAFRERLVQRIAAYRIDNPEGELDYAAIFADLFERIRQSYFEEHRERMQQLRRLFVQHLSGEGGPLEENDRATVEAVMGRLRQSFGYCEKCALETLAFLEARLYERHEPAAEASASTE